MKSGPKKERRKQQNFPNDDDLREMARHVIYEIDGFRKGFEDWKELSNQEPSPGREAFNKAVEVALLHYRTLLEFFLSKPWQVTVDENISIDVVATDYLHVSTPKNISKEAEELCEAYKARIDQQLFHISTGRRENQIWREWPTGMMKAKMECLIRRFKEDLPTERAAWFSSLATSLVESTGEISNGTPTVEVLPMPFSAPSASRR